MSGRNPSGTLAARARAATGSLMLVASMLRVRYARRLTRDDAFRRAVRPVALRSPVAQRSVSPAAMPGTPRAQPVGSARRHDARDRACQPYRSPVTGRHRGNAPAHTSHAPLRRYDRAAPPPARASDHRARRLASQAGPRAAHGSTPRAAWPHPAGRRAWPGASQGSPDTARLPAGQDMGAQIDADRDSRSVSCHSTGTPVVAQSAKTCTRARLDLAPWQAEGTSGSAPFHGHTVQTQVEPRRVMPCPLGQVGHVLTAAAAEIPPSGTSSAARLISEV